MGLPAWLAKLLGAVDWGAWGWWWPVAWVGKHTTLLWTSFHHDVSLPVSDGGTITTGCMQWPLSSALLSTLNVPHDTSERSLPSKLLRPTSPVHATLLADYASPVLLRTFSQMWSPNHKSGIQWLGSCNRNNGMSRQKFKSSSVP